MRPARMIAAAVAQAKRAVTTPRGRSAPATSTYTWNTCRTVVMKTELAQSYMAQARSSGRSSPRRARKPLKAAVSALGPEEDPLVGEEVGVGVGQPGEELLAVALDEGGEEIPGEAPLVVREQGPLHPLHDLLPRLQAVAVDLEADVLLAIAQLVEDHRVLLGRQDGAPPEVAAEGRPEGLLPGHLARRDLGGVVVVGRHLDRELAPRGEAQGEPPEHVLVERHPVERRVREDQVPGAPRIVDEGEDVPPLERQSLARVTPALLEHGLRAVDAQGLSGAETVVQGPGQLAGAAAQVDHPHPGPRPHEAQDVEEGLAALVAEPFVLAGVPDVLGHQSGLSLAFVRAAMLRRNSRATSAGARWRPSTAWFIRRMAAS